jgi:Zn-dependent peptidase ImmA (M78 family)
MLIGNRNSLGFELSPLSPTWKTRYVPEKGAWAALSVWVGGRNLCRHIRSGADYVHEALNVPLVPVADWFYRSWAPLELEERAPEYPTGRTPHESLIRWGDTRPPKDFSDDAWIDARETWWTRHFWASGADGAQLPNLGFLRQDDEFIISWKAPRFAGDRSPSLLEAEGQAVVPWAEASATIVSLISTVGGWVTQAGLPKQFPWQHEALAHGSLLEALAIFTGRSIDTLFGLAKVTLLDQLLTWFGLAVQATDPGASPLPQALRDLPPHPTPAVADLLNLLNVKTLSHDKDMTAWRDLRVLSRDAAESAANPEEAGQLAACALRDAWKLPVEPIGEVEPVLRSRCGVMTFDTGVSALSERMMTGAREDGNAVVLMIDAPRTRTHWGRRFEVCRALGHLLLDSTRGGAIGAASSPYAQDTRRRRSGAFAAEFLLPDAAMAAVCGGKLDAVVDPKAFGDLMEKYGVGARTAAHQLWNRGWLSGPGLRDELIDHHAQHSHGAGP